MEEKTRSGPDIVNDFSRLHKYEMENYMSTENPGHCWHKVVGGPGWRVHYDPLFFYFHLFIFSLYLHFCQTCCNCPCDVTTHLIDWS